MLVKVSLSNLRVLCGCEMGWKEFGQERRGRSREHVYVLSEPAAPRVRCETSPRRRALAVQLLSRDTPFSTLALGSSARSAAGASRREQVDLGKQPWLREAPVLYWVGDGAGTGPGPVQQLGAEKRIASSCTIAE